MAADSGDDRPKRNKPPRSPGRPPGVREKRPRKRSWRQADELRHKVQLANGRVEHLTSLQFFQRVYSDPNMKFEYRMEAAKAALPYEHAKVPQERIISGELTHTEVRVSVTEDFLARVLGKPKEAISSEIDRVIEHQSESESEDQDDGE